MSGHDRRTQGDVDGSSYVQRTVAASGPRRSRLPRLIRRSPSRLFIETTRQRPMTKHDSQDSGRVASRRGFLKLAGASGIATAANVISGPASAAAATPDGTPEQ